MKNLICTGLPAAVAVFEFSREATEYRKDFIIKALVDGESFEVWEGRQLRDFTYVDDAVNAFLMAATSEAANGEIFNLGGDCVISLNDLAELLIEVNGGGEFVRRSYPPDCKRIDIGDYYADFSRIRSMLGWRPTTSLREGLSRTFAYYREHLPKYL